MDPRYPVGQFIADDNVTPAKRRAWIAEIDALPRNLQAALAALAPAAIDTPYRDGGWTARQVVHHLADSHMNACFRIKLALTEETPAIKTYEEQLWAELADGKTADPSISVQILEGIHKRLTMLLESLTPEQFARPAQHPQWGHITVDWIIQMYEWHCRHHLAHIGLAAERASAAAR